MNNSQRMLETYEGVFEYSPEMIKESMERNDGKIILNGILQKADTLNQNGRIYPLEVLEREVKNYQKFIIENRALGELDHPETSVVELKNVSHIIREAYMDGNVVRGKLEVLHKVPNGAILKGLIESGVKIGISSRGVGSTKKEGDYYVVQDDFQLICWDMVSEPSTPSAFMIPEGKTFNPNALKSVFMKSDRIDRVINEILSDR